MTLFATSKLQSKEIVDLLNEYYMMLPQDVRDRKQQGGRVTIENEEELRSRLPPPELFEGTIVVRKKPVAFASRLEYFKSAYMERCLQSNADDPSRRQGTRRGQGFGRFRFVQLTLSIRLRCRNVGTRENVSEPH